MKNMIEFKGRAFSKMSKAKAYDVKRMVDNHKFEGLAFFYQKWSEAKENALIYCQRLAHNIGCDDWGVIRANSCTFSFGAYYKDNNKLIILYCTRDNDYLYMEVL